MDELDLRDCPDAEEEMPPVPETVRELFEQVFGGDGAAELSDEEIESRFREFFMDNFMILFTDYGSPLNLELLGLSADELTVLGMPTFAQFAASDGTGTFLDEEDRLALSDEEIALRLEEYSTAELSQLLSEAAAFVDPRNPTQSEIMGFVFHPYFGSPQLERFIDVSEHYAAAVEFERVKPLIEAWRPAEQRQQLETLQGLIDVMPDSVWGIPVAHIRQSFQDYHDAELQHYRELEDLQARYPSVANAEEQAMMEIYRQMLMATLPQQYPQAYAWEFGDRTDSPELQELLNFMSLMQQGPGFEMFFRYPWQILREAVSGFPEIWREGLENPEGYTAWGNLEDFWRFFREGEGIAVFSDVADLLYALRRWYRCQGGLGDVALSAVPFISAANARRLFEIVGNTAEVTRNMDVDEFLEILGDANRLQADNMAHLLRMGDQRINVLFDFLGDTQFRNLLEDADFIAQLGDDFNVDDVIRRYGDDAARARWYAYELNEFGLPAGQRPRSHEGLTAVRLQDQEDMVIRRPYGDQEVIWIRDPDAPSGRRQVVFHQTDDFVDPVLGIQYEFVTATPNRPNFNMEEFIQAMDTHFRDKVETDYFVVDLQELFDNNMHTEIQRVYNHYDANLSNFTNVIWIPPR